MSQLRQIQDRDEAAKAFRRLSHRLLQSFPELSAACRTLAGSIVEGEELQACDALRRFGRRRINEIFGVESVEVTLQLSGDVPVHLEN